MADFLAKLAGRTLGTEPLPRPVIAPMFAPGPMMAGEYLPEAAPQETLAGDRLSSLMPLSARLEQLELATRPERRVDVGPGTREFIAQRMSRLDAHQPGSHTIVSRGEQPPIANQQPGPGSITPRIQTDFSPLKESITLISPRTSIQEERLGARLVNSRRESHPASAPAPIIKVSIGRIDVRAVTSTASMATQKAPPSRPQPSLEEYLQARNRGKR
jgi:hypothetical protein